MVKASIWITLNGRCDLVSSLMSFAPSGGLGTFTAHGLSPTSLLVALSTPSSSYVYDHYFLTNIDDVTHRLSSETIHENDRP